MGYPIEATMKTKIPEIRRQEQAIVAISRDELLISEISAESLAQVANPLLQIDTETGDVKPVSLVSLTFELKAEE